MKVEIEVPDPMIPFFTAEAASHKITLAELLAAKIFWQRHDVVVRGGIIPAPSEAHVAGLAAAAAAAAAEKPPTS